MIQIPGGLHGAYTQEQARAALGVHGLRAAVDRGQLVGFARGVLVLADRQHELRTRAAAAQLLAGPHSVLVRSTAAQLHGCSAIAGFPVHIRVPYQRRLRSRAGLFVHQGPVREWEIGCVDGLRVLNPAPTLTDLLRSASRRAALACADQILRGLPVPDRVALRDAVAQTLADDPDQRGVARATELLRLASGLPESPEQSAILLTMADGGLQLPLCQYPVHDAAGQVSHQLDFAWPQELVALEYRDGSRAPADISQLSDADLRRRGWLILRADAEALVDPANLLRQLREALAHRRLAA